MDEYTSQMGEWFPVISTRVVYESTVYCRVSVYAVLFNASHERVNCDVSVLRYCSLMLCLICDMWTVVEWNGAEHCFKKCEKTHLESYTVSERSEMFLNGNSQTYRVKECELYCVILQYSLRSKRIGYYIFLSAKIIAQLKPPSHSSRLELEATKSVSNGLLRVSFVVLKWKKDCATKKGKIIPKVETETCLTQLIKQLILKWTKMTVGQKLFVRNGSLKI